MKHLDLYGYQAWRRSVEPPAVGTIFKFLQPIKGYQNSKDNIKAQKRYVVTEIVAPISYKDSKLGADRVCILNAITKSGVLQKQSCYISAEQIAEWLWDGIIVVDES